MQRGKLFSRTLSSLVQIYFPLLFLALHSHKTQQQNCTHRLTTRGYHIRNLKKTPRPPTHLSTRIHSAICQVSTADRK